MFSSGSAVGATPLGRTTGLASTLSKAVFSILNQFLGGGDFCVRILYIIATYFNKTF
jgi:hypothetical protein